MKGSDGESIQQKALALGAIPRALERTVEALTFISHLRSNIIVTTYPDEMGADALHGFEAQIFGKIIPGKTTASDTQRAAKHMAEMGVDLLLFAGGDGTARDICDAVGVSIPTLGIPAGVKIHSSVYAINPRSAGQLAAMFLENQVVYLQEAEVMDIDEQAFRQGIVSAQLYGYLKIPYEAQFVQNPKSTTPASDLASAKEIAAMVVSQMKNDVMYIIGPGTTMRTIMSELGLKKTLIGVDVLRNKKMLAEDVNEQQLLNLLDQYPVAKIVVTPIGGQGFLFGRGNQQISPQVIQKVGKDNLIVVSTVHKLISMNGRPLLVDTGDEKTDRLLQGYFSVTTGLNESMIYFVSNSS